MTSTKPSWADVAADPEWRFLANALGDEGTAWRRRVEQHYDSDNVTAGATQPADLRPGGTGARFGVYVRCSTYAERGPMDGDEFVDLGLGVTDADIQPFLGAQSGSCAVRLGRPPSYIVPAASQPQPLILFAPNAADDAPTAAAAKTAQASRRDLLRHAAVFAAAAELLENVYHGAPLIRTLRHQAAELRAEQPGKRTLALLDLMCRYRYDDARALQRHANRTPGRSDGDAAAELLYDPSLLQKTLRSYGAAVWVAARQPAVAIRDDVAVGRVVATDIPYFGRTPHVL